jgi:hypothetical protein
MMTKYRGSWWKTALTAALVALSGFTALAWLLSEKLIAQRPWSLLIMALWCTGSLVLLCGVTAAVLVLAGALISLHRDTLESRGLPYAARRPRECHDELAGRVLRAAFRVFRTIWGRRPGQLDLRPGELVEIRTRDEILATLDDRGALDSLPFMPEMAVWCGRQVRVFRRVNKVYDWILCSGLRRMQDTVILEGLRCDGSHHGECQSDCQTLWKEAWLRRASTDSERPIMPVTDSPSRLDLCQFTQRVDTETSEPRFVCQMTRLPEATTPTRWNDPRNYLKEILTGNVRLGPFFAGIAILAFNSVQRRSGGVRFPFLAPAQLQKTPHAVLDLQPGELVRIKSKCEIVGTLNAQFKNRGLWFDTEMTRFCGGKYRVLARVNRQIEERSGKMLIFTNPCITLEGVTAPGECHELAPLDERIYWRELWLERVTEPASHKSQCHS